MKEPRHRLSFRNPPSLPWFRTGEACGRQTLLSPPRHPRALSLSCNPKYPFLGFHGLELQILLSQVDVKKNRGFQGSFCGCGSNMESDSMCC
uniref:Uncharacterized protein n=1 Tax=Physcomitrium patens TaxID=3218 RepID=A0A2K1JKF7_PHYPA|nr:hypothetical protein PHYPA_016864 [Physcomitrium patens]